MTEREKLPNPLPTRSDEVREKKELLKSGLVLKPLDTDEGYDISNAAQSIVAGPVLERVMESWKGLEIELDENNFYRGFCLLYFREIQKYEKEAWQNLTSEVVGDPDIDLNDLTSVQAAVLTLQSLNGYEDVALSSRELFMELSMHAKNMKSC